MSTSDLGRLDEIIAPILSRARVPGVALAVVAGHKVICTRAYGYRDLHAKLTLTSRTRYPIASATKAMNATLLGMLVDEGRLRWDAPVQDYLPSFRLHDRAISHLVTVRDLVAMRTGLPAHHFVWLENPVTRADLVGCIAHLRLSAGLRERFQYNDLTVTIAGHIAEILTGQSWETLLRERLFEPLEMNETGFDSGASDDVTRSYHENHHRELLVTRAFEVGPIGPAGGSIYSTVEDMARWMRFNLNGGHAAGCRLIRPETLKELHSPCVLMGTDPAAPSPGAAYGLGWFVDTYQGRTRVSHTGWLHDVNSCVTLFPTENLGIVSFTNFASARLSSFINQCVFESILRLNPAQTLDQMLASYETKIEENQRRNASVLRVENTSPSHVLEAYAGVYENPGYGAIQIQRGGDGLVFQRNHLELPLRHWHYDAWVVSGNDLFEIHKPQFCDRVNRIVFETDADGDIEAFSMSLEPSVAPARFAKRH